MLLIHVVISLVGIFTGFVVVLGILTAKPMPGWTAVFLATTVVTSATGFLLPAAHFMPSHVIAILSLIVLALAIYAYYLRHLQGGWRKVYVITALAALYFNTFVGVVQAFQKVPALKVLAPKQTEPPFQIAQAALLVLFVVVGILGARKWSAQSPVRNE
jgi:hypothetical protein